jgi:PHD-zinc-finger like domain
VAYSIFPLMCSHKSHVCACSAAERSRNRLCDPCLAGQNTLRTACRFCPSRGGALKVCTDGRTWAHALCTYWIPEAYTFTDPVVPTAAVTAKGDTPVATTVDVVGAVGPRAERLGVEGVWHNIPTLYTHLCVCLLCSCSTMM